MGKVQLGKTIEDSDADAIRLFFQSLTGRIPGDCLLIPVLPARE
jgi:hypothetical protein